MAPPRKKRENQFFDVGNEGRFVYSPDATALTIAGKPASPSPSCPETAMDSKTLTACSRRPPNPQSAPRARTQPGPTRQRPPARSLGKRPYSHLRPADHLSKQTLARRRAAIHLSRRGRNPHGPRGLSRGGWTLRPTCRARASRARPEGRATYPRRRRSTTISGRRPRLRSGTPLRSRA
jgi:hypothetical protein